MKKLFFKIVLVFLAFLVGAFLFEMLLRFILPEPENLAKLKSSPVFLLENKPGTKFNYQSPSDGISVEIAMNSDGFRDFEFKKEKPRDVYRIAVLGDSFEEALQVEIEDTWQKVLSRNLSKKWAKEVEIYNFGVSGYGTDQEYLTLREKVWKFNPDLVILAFTPNDVGDTYKNKLVVLDETGVYLTKPSESLKGNLLGNFFRKTYAYHLLIKAASGRESTKRVAEKIRTKILGFPKEDRFFLSDAQLIQGPFEVMATKKNPPYEVLEGRKMVRALILKMKEEVEKKGAKFLVTFNIPKSVVSSAVWEGVLKEYNLDPNEASSTEEIDILSSFLKSKLIDYYNLTQEAVLWNKANGDIHFERDAHYNKNGHMLIGNKLADYIFISGLANQN